MKYYDKASLPVPQLRPENDHSKPQADHWGRKTTRQAEAD
jgi:hypothetical protein